MSLKRKSPSKQDSKTPGSSLRRSFSFGGFLNSKNLSTPTSPIGVPPLLGESFRTPTRPRRKGTSAGFGVSFSAKKPKVPKVPRPQRALMVCEHVKAGVHQCIAITNDDLEKMKLSEDLSTSSTGQAKVLEVEKQYKAAERYKKKLEFHLSKIEELEENYKLQQQMREGAKNMARAFTSQQDAHKKSSIFSVKAGYKECTQVMCGIEAQLESMLGTFHCELQGLVGFARMMPGDIYEVILRHGHQKWKSKGKIGINTQTWDQNSFVFKVLLGDVLNIKASELKTIKTITLGHKNCEVKNLFSSHPQLMTVSLNTNGSIKLNLVVSWNPLEGVDDSYFVETRPSSAPKRRVQSMYVTNPPYYVPSATTVDESNFLLKPGDSASDLGSDLTNDSGGQFQSPSYSFHAYLGGAAAGGGLGGGGSLTTSPEHTPTATAATNSQQKSNTAPAARPKSIAVMGTINESSTDSRNTEKNNYVQSTTSFGAETQRLSTPDLGGGFHFNHLDMDLLTGRANNISGCSPDLTDDSSCTSPQHTSPTLTEVVKRPLARTSSKYIELGRKPTKSSFSNDISMYTPKSLSGYHPSSTNHVQSNKAREDYNSPAGKTERTAGAAQQQQIGGESHNVINQNKVYVYSPKSYHLSPTSPTQTRQLQSISNKSPQLSTGGGVSSYSQNNNRSPRGPPRPKTNPYSMRQVSEALPTTAATIGKVLTSGNIQDALLSLRATLEDYQGQYPEIQKLEEQVHYLDRLLKKSLPQSPNSEDVGISIEDALNAFDFLETEYYIDGYGSSGPSRHSSYEQLENKCNSLSPESTAKTSDSGIECLATRLTEDHVSSPLSPEVQTTGNEQVDRVLVWHLGYCERLLENLGQFGPLRCKEIYSLDKLSRQAHVIEHLIKMARKFPGQIRDLQAVMSDLTKEMESKKFWVRCTDHNVLFTSPERFLAQLERSYGEFVRQKYEVTSIVVFKTLVARIIDEPYFEPGMLRPSPIVTLHQVMGYFHQADQKSLPNNIQQLAGELWLLNRLQSGNTEVVVQTLLTFRNALPPQQCLRTVAVLLICNDMDVRNAAASYLQSLCTKEGLRKQAIIVYVEGLEAKNVDLRSGSCVGLKLLQAVESVHQLVYVCSTDSSLMVQHRAKEALFALGDEGRKVYLDNQLASHGFQGVNVKL